MLLFTMILRRLLDIFEFLNIFRDCLDFISNDPYLRKIGHVEPVFSRVSNSFIATHDACQYPFKHQDCNNWQDAKYSHIKGFRYPPLIMDVINRASTEFYHFLCSLFEVYKGFCWQMIIKDTFCFYWVFKFNTCCVLHNDLFLVVIVVFIYDLLLSYFLFILFIIR